MAHRHHHSKHHGKHHGKHHMAHGGPAGKHKSGKQHVAGHEHEDKLDYPDHHSQVERGGVSGTPDYSGGKENVAKEARVMTDEAGYYLPLADEFAEHGRVNHSGGQYVRGDATRIRLRTITRSSSAA